MNSAADAALPTASWGRRLVALLVDWLVSTLAVVAFVGWEQYSSPGGHEGFIVLGVYVVESALFTWLLGGSFGKVATGLRVVPADGAFRALNPLRLLLRQIMVAVVIPPLVFQPDRRGLHDIVAGTATVNVDVYRSMLARAQGAR